MTIRTVALHYLAWLVVTVMTGLAFVAAVAFGWAEAPFRVLHLFAPLAGICAVGVALAGEYITLEHPLERHIWQRRVNRVFVAGSWLLTLGPAVGLLTGERGVLPDSVAGWVNSVGAGVVAFAVARAVRISWRCR